MEIGNTTGDDAKYRVTNTGTQGMDNKPPSWQSLSGYGRTQHPVRGTGPWQVEFLVATRDGQATVSRVAHRATDIVELAAGDGVHSILLRTQAA
jgi:hypothetical protein